VAANEPSGQARKIGISATRVAEPRAAPTARKCAAPVRWSAPREGSNETPPVTFTSAPRTPNAVMAPAMKRKMSPVVGVPQCRVSIIPDVHTVTV
jgi:hypothetical protein